MSYPPYGAIPGRSCQRCGRPLPSNEGYCRTCGQYNAPLPTNDAGDQVEQQPFPGMPWGTASPQTSYGGQLWGQSSASPASNVANGGSSSFQQPSYPNNYSGVLNQQPSYPNNYSGVSNSPQSPFNYYGAPQQSIYSSPPPNSLSGFQPGTTNGLPPARYNESPPPKRGPNAGLIIGIVLLLVLLVGGGIGGYLFLKNQNNASKITTTITQAATPSPSPSGPALFSDTFANNTNGWDLTGSPGKISIKLGGGSMVLEDDENSLFPEFIPGKTFGDFQLHVDAVLSKGDQNNGYGVYIRTASTQNTELGTFYRFEIYGDGSYAVFKGTVDSGGNSTSNKLVDFTANGAIQKQGGLNHLTIVAKGSSMMFVVNGTTLTTITDNSYRSGSAALFVSNVKGVPAGAEATFSHLAIYPVA